MTEPDDRYNEEMRRALSAAADLVVPAGDGLEKIRERVVHRPALHAWIVAYTQDLPHRFVTSLRVAATSLTALGGGSPGAAMQPPGGRRRPRFSRESSWVRPTLAAVGALAIVAIAATVILPRLTQPVSNSAFGNNPSSQNAGSSGAGNSSPSSQQNSAGVFPLSSHSPRSLITMPPPTRCVTQEPSSSGSPSPTPTGTTPSTYISPSPAPGPTETVTPTTSPDLGNMIGEEPVLAGQQRSATTVTPCASHTPTTGPTSAPPTSVPPTSTPPTSSPPTSSPPTSSPPTSPPTSPTTGVPTPQGSVTPTAPPPLP